MRLYHFDASDGRGTLASDSRTLAHHVAAGRHATLFAASLIADAPHDSNIGGAILIEVYTAEDGPVLTLRMVTSIEVRETGSP